MRAAVTFVILEIVKLWHFPTVLVFDYHNQFRTSILMGKHRLDMHGQH